MSEVPLYNVLKVVAPVTALLGSHPKLRVYAYGKAPQGVQRPYLVWQDITGSPENNLSQLPDYDYYSIQIDIYAKTDLSCDAVKRAVRDAIEPLMHITSWYGDDRDDKTDDYRTTFAVDWFVQR